MVNIISDDDVTEAFMLRLMELEIMARPRSPKFYARFALGMIRYRLPGYAAWEKLHPIWHLWSVE